MKIKNISVAAAALLLSTSLFAQTAGQKKILWDCTHAETSGNGDWCIDADLHDMNWSPGPVTGSGDNRSNPQQYPTPSQTTVISSTTETYWEGALSYWGIDCVNKGYWVETLPPFTGQITYGSSTNTQDLSKYNVFVVDEPNIRFTQAEITAIMQFIENGGSLCAISDHTGSDRNNDGWDSPMIWNDFMTNNPVQNNAFGYTFALENFSDGSSSPNTNVATSSTDSITRGPYGNVAEVKWSNGTCMVMNPSQNASVKGHVWKAGLGQTDTAVCCVTARWKCGKIASIGDSSPPDDGTGNPAVSLYNGYTADAAGNHRPWLMNIMIWLAEGGTCSGAMGIGSIKESNTVSVYPNPMVNELTIKLPFVAQKASASMVDVLGKELISTEIASGSEISIKDANLPAGVYFVKVMADGKAQQVIKVIKQ
ncbi:MAG: T9SS type A sorting domain-containing protein [Bacteroidia bacterium]